MLIPQRIPTRYTDPVVGLLARIGITPNMLTIFGLLGNVVAAVLIGQGWFVAGGAVMLVFSLLDAFDGALARATGQATPFGSVLDASFDRVSEALVLFGLAWYYVRNGEDTLTLVVMAAMIGSLLVSYVRARVEVTGERLMEGFFTRSVRVALLVIAFILSGIAGRGSITVAVWILAVMANLTAAHRLFLAWRKLTP